MDVRHGLFLAFIASSCHGHAEAVFKIGGFVPNLATALSLVCYVLKSSFSQNVVSRTFACVLRRLFAWALPLFYSYMEDFYRIR